MTLRKIILNKDRQDELRKYASSLEPDESCALLFGTYDGEKIMASEVFFTKNAKRSRVDFAISNEELIRGYRTAEELGLDVVGIFHSHPDSEAVPSSTDRKFMQANPVAWVIYSGKTGDLRAYMLESEMVEIRILRDRS